MFKALAALFAGGMAIGLVLVFLFFTVLIFVFAFIVVGAITGSMFAGVIGGFVALAFCAVMIAGSMQ